VLEVLTTEAEAKVLSGASGVMGAATRLFASDCPRMTIAPKPPATWFAGLHTLAPSGRAGFIIPFYLGQRESNGN
jgi:hypothetical protein